MSALSTRLKLAFAPPRYLVPNIAGVDLSLSGIKIAQLAESANGLILDRFAEIRVPTGAYADGEIIDGSAVTEALRQVRSQYKIEHVYASLPESKSYLFETRTEGGDKSMWMTAVEQRLDELIPLSPSDATFDLVRVGKEGSENLVAGIGYARRLVDMLLAAFDDAGLMVHALEGENFALARALLPYGDLSTVLVIDIGKTTTKIIILAAGVPRFATTIGIGGHALTLAVQKHFGVTEEEAKRVKAERGIVAAPGNEDYIAAMLSTVSAIRDEIARRLTYWQTHVAVDKGHEKVSRAIIVGGNASVRGLPEYLEGALAIPVATGDVFCNLASRDKWLPPLDYLPSLAYGTAIGLALRSYAP